MDFTKEILDLFEQRLKQHHEIYRIPVKAETWEDLADQVINQENSNFVPFNHSTGHDLNFEISKNNFFTQLKTGIIKNNKLVFSSHRLGRFETLEQKLDFLEEVDYDSFLFLSRNESDVWDKKYYINYLDKKDINYKNLSWKEIIGKRGKYKNRISGWEGISTDGKIKCSITKSMSHQLWVEIDTSLIKLIKKIIIC
jgi:hypothetical protein